MTTQTATNENYRIWLSERLEEKRRRNPAYSLRSFARQVGVSASLLSQIMSGKSPLTRKTAEKISRRLGLSPTEKLILIKSILDLPDDSTDQRAGGSFDQVEYRRLEMEKFKAIADWYHYAILSLADVEGSRADCHWFAERLGITLSQARGAWARLKLLGLVEEHGDGSFSQGGPPLTTSRDVASTAIRRYHRQNLEKAETALDTVPVTDRYFSAMTLAVSRDDYADAKEEITRFRRRLAEKYSSGDDKQRVYTMAVQLFPLDTYEFTSDDNGGNE